MSVTCSILKFYDSEVIRIIPKDELRAAWIDRLPGGPGSSVTLRGVTASHRDTFFMVSYILSNRLGDMGIECADEADAKFVLDAFTELSKYLYDIDLEKRDGRWCTR
jgi:hypothetical protein